MKVVYATSTASVTMPGGWPLLVRKGSHWSADDPVVRQQPSLFSDEPDRAGQNAVLVAYWLLLNSRLRLLSLQVEV